MKQIDKRQQLVNTALKLFYEKGIHAVGINEILVESGIAKKTLYNHFASKEALIQACVIERDQSFMTWFIQKCNDNSSTTVFIEQVFDALDEWINDKSVELGSFSGCFFVNSAAEYSDHHNEIKKLCLQHKTHIKHFFEQQLEPLISDKNQLTSLVELLLLLKEGCINCAHVMGDKQSALKAKALALVF
ncbi:TetR/AcrR family transcriptional regulator [Colwellia sp. 20A7]|uniref:TetR/AcrR family transcriptional regulator n=1 Tax=Colwellia sp. 20A7 TaxID=2689569 RepID=UPI001F3113DD|nr:TetR/AcrR family transcriptional regulator [Colwellia sp. 20A7]